MYKNPHPPMTWILAANSEVAHFFQASPKKIHLLEEVEHKEGREKVSDIVTDRPGRTFARTGIVRHMLNEGQDVHRHEQEKFAHALFRSCKEKKQARSFDQLVLIAPPQFLGALRQEFEKDPLLKQSVIREIPKEVLPSWPLEKRIEYISSLLEIQ